jgi:molybdopterin converting factor small subunit
MATVHIPAAMRKLTGGAARLAVSGETLGEVIETLEVACPGLRSRLVEGEKLRPGLAVFIDGETPSGGLRAKVAPEAEIYFAPAIAGG